MSTLQEHGKYWARGKPPSFDGWLRSNATKAVPPDAGQHKLAGGTNQDYAAVVASLRGEYPILKVCLLHLTRRYVKKGDNLEVVKANTISISVA